MVIKMTNILQKISKSSLVHSFLHPPNIMKKISKRKCKAISSLELVHSKYVDFYQCPFIQTIYILLSHPIK